MVVVVEHEQAHTTINNNDDCLENSGMSKPRQERKRVTYNAFFKNGFALFFV